MNNLFKKEETILTIKYDKNQIKGFNHQNIAIFYNELANIFDSLNIETELIIENGSYITKVFTEIGIGLGLQLGNIFLNPEGPYVKPVWNIQNSFNNINFCLFKCDQQTIYDKNNLKQIIDKTQEEVKKYEKQQKLHNTTIPENIETLQMTITAEKISTIIENKQGNVKKITKYQFVAKFDDIRYKNISNEIKIETTATKFKNIDISQIHNYYFIADGILYKQNNKYIKFEIINLQKLSMINNVIPNLCKTTN